MAGIEKMREENWREKIYGGKIGREKIYGGKFGREKIYDGRKFMAGNLGGRCCAITFGGKIGRIKYITTKTNRGPKCKKTNFSSGCGPKHIWVGSPPTRKGG